MLNHCLSVSEFDLADTETTNFWQRSRHSLDFSLILDFAHAQQTEKIFVCFLSIAKLVRFFALVQRNEQADLVKQKK